jgi:hypothetical protein
MVGSTDLNEIRRDNLRKLIAQYDGPAALGRKLGYSNASFLVQMAGPNPTRGVTEKRCREFEEKLDLPKGWFDRPAPGGPVIVGGGAPAIAAAAPSNEVNNDLLGQVLKIVAEVCSDLGVNLSHSKFADLAALIYSEAAEAGRVPPVANIRRLVALLK